MRRGSRRGKKQISDEKFVAENRQSGFRPHPVNRGGSMALKITLKPGERIIVGGAAIKNGSSSTSLLVENPVPILRQRDILTQEQADTPCKRIYLVVQLMYIDGTNLATHHKTYWSLVKDLLKAAPSTLLFVDRISDLILGAKYYQALKMARKLIEYEEEVVRHARRSTGNL